MKKSKKNIKPIKKDKNGFTLVELLAVIVVLALLILIAGRAVFAQIEKSRKNTFRTEILTIGKAADDMFKTSSIDNDTWTVTIGTDEYEYACATPEELKDGGFLEFSDSKTFNGRIQVFRNTATEEKTVYVTVEDGRRYAYVNQKLSDIEDRNVDDPILTNYKTDSLDAADESCPADEAAVTAIPVAIPVPTT